MENRSNKTVSIEIGGDKRTQSGKKGLENCYINRGRTRYSPGRNDGCDYMPANKWVVFGQHFAAIAGAGPLIGPALAAQFGWGPGFFGILIGSVFAGEVHDMFRARQKINFLSFS